MNKKHIIVFIIAFAAMIFTTSLQAQATNSAYSVFGVGQIIDNNYGINRSLGGTGIAFQSGKSINYTNPASYLGISSSLIMELGVSGIYNKSDTESTSQTAADINITYFSANLYLASWWAASIGIFPFSSVHYEVNSSDDIHDELTSFEKSFEGTGGLNRASVGNSFMIGKGLAVGFNASYIFGALTQTETAFSNDNFVGYELRNERVAHSFYFDYGLQYSIHNDEWLYSVGLIYGADTKINSTDNFEFINNEIASSLEHDNLSDIKIPQKFGLGFSGKKGSRFKVGFDYEWQNWSNVSFSNPNFDSKNSNRFSVGVEYSPTQTEKKLFYRFGANYKNSYLEVNTTPINFVGVNFGIGIPYNETGILNLSIEYGKEGTLNEGLIMNSYWGVHINYSLHEIWSPK